MISLISRHAWFIILVMGAPRMQEVLYFADKALILPPYPIIAIQNHLEGSISLIVTYESNRVQSTKMISSTFVKGGVPINDSEISVKRLESFVIAAIKQWTTAENGVITQPVVIEFKIDRSLKGSERRYLIEHGDAWRIKGITISSGDAP